MVKDHVLTANSFFNDLADFMPPGLFLSFAAACIAERRYFEAYVKEFIGSMMMIAFTFSAGKWIGQDDIMVAWTWHAIGVVAADYFGGGQQVNPAVTMSMWALGKVSYTEAFVRVAGQMGGGMISFPLFHALSLAMNWEPFGGPEFNQTANGEAAISEFVSTFLLMWAIYIVSCIAALSILTEIWSWVAFLTLLDVSFVACRSSTGSCILENSTTLSSKL